MCAKRYNRPMKLLEPTKKRLWLVILVLLLVVVAGITTYGLLHSREFANVYELHATETRAFPAYSDGELSHAQEKLVAIIKTEFNSQPEGTKYSEGVSESWCADFVSWVAKQNGTPFSNPNSGSWRIPGTHTLREYFESKGIWHTYESGYQPKTGDIAIYDGNGPFGQHTNFVMRNDNGTLTTVGGNEAGAIRVQQHVLDADLHVLGFASL